MDPQAARAAQLAKEAGAIVVEDSAPAVLTDRVTGRRDGGASIFRCTLPPVSRGLLLMKELPEKRYRRQEKRSAP